jgi:hypothetical protein
MDSDGSYSQRMVRIGENKNDNLSSVILYKPKRQSQFARIDSNRRYDRILKKNLKKTGSMLKLEGDQEFADDKIMC